MYPVVKWYGEGIALGYVLMRLLEAVAIVVGIISVLAIVSLRQAAGGTAAALLPVNEALVAIHDWTFLVGPLWFFGTNSLLLAYLMYRSGLVPPVIALLGMVGGFKTPQPAADRMQPAAADPALSPA